MLARACEIEELNCNSYELSYLLIVVCAILEVSLRQHNNNNNNNDDDDDDDDDDIDLIYITLGPLYSAQI